MSGLAYYLKKTGHYVQGSDIANFAMAQKLEKIGIPVFKSHNKNNIKDCNCIVYNCAINSNNEELIEAKNNNLKILSRAQLLGMIAKDFKFLISVAGSHGKTTTSAMLFSCLNYAQLKPSLHFGAQLEGYDFGFILQKKNILITEACEYKDSFLNLNSNIGIILNIEPEHLDYFKNIHNEINSYKKFAQQCDKVVTNENKLKLENMIIFKGKNSIIEAKNIKIANHKYQYDCYFKSKFLTHIELGALGKYNITNSLAVVLTCIILKIPIDCIVQGLKNFKGVKRRFEILNNKHTLAVHDYAHHPTEIKKTIKTFKEYAGDKKTLVVFQPHTYSRTKNLYKQFLTCFDDCDKLILVKTYPAREKYDKTASAFRLYKDIKNVSCEYYAKFDVILKKIIKYIQNGYAVLILGAGDIDSVAYSLKDILKDSL